MANFFEPTWVLHNYWTEIWQKKIEGFDKF